MFFELKDQVKDQEKLKMFFPFFGFSCRKLVGNSCGKGLRIRLK